MESPVESPAWGHTTFSLGTWTQPTKLVGFQAFAIAGSKPRKGGME